MNVKRTAGILALSSVVAVALFLAPAGFGAAAEKTVYTKYNIHLQCKPDRDGAMRCEGSYANWTDPGHGHYIIPLNTPVRAERDRNLELTVQDPGAVKLPVGKVVIEFHPIRMAMNIDQYLELITSPSPVPTDRFGAKDLEGIKAGKALIGMTKQGVMAALGYPAVHETPSLEADAYVYWTNRFRRRRVDFSDQGLVVNVQ